MYKIGLFYIGGTCLILGALISLLTTYVGLHMSIVFGHTSLWAGALFLFLYQFFSGSFIDYRWALRGLLLCLCLFIASGIFKLAEMQGAHILLALSVLGPAMLYLPHFFQKKPKKYPDFLKLGWTGTFFIGTYGKIIEWPYSTELLWASCAILFLLSLDTYIKLKRAQN